MTRIRTIIIDDEMNAIGALKNLLKHYCHHIEVIAHASSAREGKEKIEEHKPDLIFLDIAMPGGDGFSLLEHFEHPDFSIVFITAYNEYAIKAFEFSAMHYILKPVDYRKLQEVEDRIIRNLDADTKSDILDTLSYNFKNDLKKLVLSSQEKVEVVNTEEIIYTEAVNNYVVFYCINEKSIVITKQLNFYEKLLCEQDFFRIHHGYLVNLRHITEYIKGRGGKVILTDGKILDVSTRKKHDFLEAFNNFLDKG